MRQAVVLQKQNEEIVEVDVRLFGQLPELAHVGCIERGSEIPADLFEAGNLAECFFGQGAVDDVAQPGLGCLIHIRKHLLAQAVGQILAQHEVFTQDDIVDGFPDQGLQGQTGEPDIPVACQDPPDRFRASFDEGVGHLVAEVASLCDELQMLVADPAGELKQMFLCEASAMKQHRTGHFEFVFGQFHGQVHRRAGVGGQALRQPGASLRGHRGIEQEGDLGEQAQFIVCA